MTDSLETTPWYTEGPDMRSVPPGQAPKSTYLIGSGDVPLRVFLRRSAWDEIADFTVDAHRPKGGILVGRVAADDAGRFVIIEGAIPAHEARATGDSITFTERTWHELEEKIKRTFPGMLVVGWFHAHPGTGVALSSYDRVAARRFFSQWWQLTYVIDQVRHRQALYSWRDGELKSLPGFWIWDENMAADDEPTPAAATGDAYEKYATAEIDAEDGVYERFWEALVGKRRGAAAALAAVCLAFSIWAVTPLPGSLHWLKRQLDDYALEAEQLQGELVRLRERHAQLNEELAREEGRHRNVAAASGHAIERPVQPTSDTPTASFGTSPTSPASSPASNETKAAVPDYVVRTGDTLWSISERLLGDPHAFWRLVELNDIDNPDLILPGWELTLPDGQQRSQP